MKLTDLKDINYKYEIFAQKKYKYEILIFVV